MPVFITSTLGVFLSRSAGDELTCAVIVLLSIRVRELGESRIFSLRREPLMTTGLRS